MSWIQGMAQRARELLRPHTSDLEIDEELRDHFEREVERLIRAGASPEDARRAARLRIGGHQSARDAVQDGRTGRLFADLVTDLRTAFRGIRREPGFTAAVVLSLGLGIGGTDRHFQRRLRRPAAPVAVSTESDRLHLVNIWWNDFSASLSSADFSRFVSPAPASPTSVASPSLTTALRSAETRDPSSSRELSSPPSSRVCWVRRLSWGQDSR